jgi:TP901 family phage tail tape measure protein
MAGNGALDLSIRIMGKVDPSLTKTISQVKGLTGSLAGEMRGVNSLASTVTNVLGVVGKAGLALGATLTGAVAAGIQKTTNEAVKLEAQMAPVMRYVDGLADSSGKASDQMSENGKTYAQNYADMENYIQRLSMEIPRTTEQLSTMSAALGQSGKDVDEQTTSGILRDTAVAATAMDLEDRTAGDYMAKWEVSFTKKDENGNKVNYSHDDVMRLMNQINYLGANNATTAAEIASSVNKSASVGQLAGVDPSTTAAIATAMQATGVDTERTGTTISRIYTNISKGDSATKAQKEMWATLGFSASGVAKSMQEDGTGTLQKVFAAINQLPDEKKLATLNVLFNQWAVEGAAKVTNNLDLLEKTLSEVSDANYDNYKNSMEREFAINSGTQESLDIMRTNARTVLMQDVGEAFLPAQKELTRIQLDFYKEIDESLPDLSNLVTSVLPLLRNAVNGIGDAAKAALPRIQKGIDYTAEHGPEVAGAITAIVAALGAMSLAPAAYSAGSTLLYTVGNIVIGGKPSGAPGGTFGGITVRNLLGALTPTSLIQKTVSGAAFAGSNAGMFAENAKYGAQMAGIGAQQPATRLGKIGQTLDGAGVGIWATMKNFKGLRSGTKKGQTGFVNDVLEASTNGGVLGLLKNSGPGKYVTGVGSAISALGNTAIGSGFVKAGGVAKQILSGIAGPKGINFPGIFAGMKSFGGATLSTMGGLGKSALGNIGKAGVGILAKTGIVQPGRGRALWRMATSTVGMNGQDALAQMGYIFSQTKGPAILANAKNKVVGGATKLAGGAIGTVKNVGQFAGAGLNVLGSTVGPVAAKLGGGFVTLLGTFGPVITGLGTMIAVVSLLGDHFEDIRNIVGTVFGEGGLAVFDKFTGKIAGIGDLAKQVFGQLSTPEGLQSIQEKLSGFSIGGLNLGDVFGAMTPAIQTVMPLVQSFAGVFSQIVDLGVNHIKPVLTEIFGFVVNEGIPAVIPLLSTVVSLVGTTLVNAIKVAVDVVGKVLPVVEPVILGVIGFLKQIATVGVKAVNFIIGALNKIQLKIPETLFGIPVPVIGGKSFGFNLSPVSVPAFANGGMTKGPSIAGEAGTEAVISFRRGVREKNVDTWLAAGKMLGVGLGDLLELPGRKPKMFADGGFTDEGTNLIDFRKARRQQRFNQIAQSFGTMFPSVAAGMVLGSDAGVAFSRVTEFANYAVDGLEALAAVQAPAVTDDQSKIVQNVNTGIGKVVTGAQTILANENAQKVIRFIRGADVEKAQLEYAANPDHYDLSNVDFFPTVYGTGVPEQDLSMLADLQASQQNVVELPSIGGGGTSGGNSGGSGGSGGTSYQRTYTSSSGNTYIYAPNFTVYGGMSADELRELLEEGYEKFCEYMEQYEHETRRKNYGT